MVICSRLWVGNFANEDVAGGVDAAFGIGVEHCGLFYTDEQDVQDL